MQSANKLHYYGAIPRLQKIVNDHGRVCEFCGFKRLEEA